MKRLPAQFVIAAKMAAATIVLVLLVLFVGGSCRERIEPGKIGSKPGWPLPAGDLETITLQPRSVTPIIELAGTVASERTIHLSARISSYVNDILVSAGQEVKQGELLIALDDRELKEQLRTAEVNLNRAHADFQRADALRASNATTAQAFDSAKAQYESAKAQLDQLKIMLTYTRITAPIDGIVTERHIEAGDLASPGLVLLALYDPARMRIEVPVPVRLLDKLKIGAELQVMIETPAVQVVGKVDEIVSAVDPVTRTRLVKVSIPDVQELFLPGAFGSIQVPGTPHTALLLPPSAIIHKGQLEIVMLVEKGRAVRRLVKTGALHGGEIELLAGLRGGDTILVNPAAQARE